MSDDTRISRVLSSVGPAGVKAGRTPALRGRLVAGIAVREQLAPRGPRSVFLGTSDSIGRWISFLSLVGAGHATAVLGHVEEEEGTFFTLTDAGRKANLSIEALAVQYLPRREPLRDW